VVLFFLQLKENGNPKVEEYWSIYKWDLFESARSLSPNSWVKRQAADLIWTFENALDENFHDGDWLQEKVNSFLKSSRYNITLSSQSIMLALDLAEKNLDISISELVSLIESTLKVRQILRLGNFSQERIFLKSLAKSGKVHETAFKDFCICLFASSEIDTLVSLIEKTAKRDFRIGPNDYSFIQKMNSWSLGLHSNFSKDEEFEEVSFESIKKTEIRIVTLDPKSSSARRVISQLSGFHVICSAGVNGASLPNEYQYLLSSSLHTYRPGTLGCFLSHYSIWAGSHDSQWTTVLEDDVTIQPKHLRNLILEVKNKEWDLVFVNDRMSSTIDNPNKDTVVQYETGKFVRPKAPGADGYIVSKAICKELVLASELKEWKGDVDHFILNCIPRLQEMGYKIGIASIPAVLHLHSRQSIRLGLD
jgi:GR25 family glycosyltransferase involved in LPS biosynthesis